MITSLNGQIIKERFHIVNKIGEGSFGEVYIAVDKKTGR